MDWAILDGEREWGVTALQAVEEMDAGPIWAGRTFPIDPTEPPRKSSLYSGPVADAAHRRVSNEVAHETVDRVERAAQPRVLSHVRAGASHLA